MMSALVRRGEETESHRGAYHVKTESEIGVRCLPAGIPRIASKHRKPGERLGTSSPSEPPEVTNPTDTLIWTVPGVVINILDKGGVRDELGQDIRIQGYRQDKT